MKIVCKTCGKVWKGRDEYEAEVNANMNPCECVEKAEKMSTEELLKEIMEKK